MGLAGRHEKQRITDDPRNTKWINDENSPGQRLLRSMGWKPDSEASSSDSSNGKTGLMAHTSSARLRKIPIAKAGMEGIGYRPNGLAAASSIGALPTSVGGSKASAASSVFARLGSKAALQFVSAGASAEVVNRAKTDGGEFAGLLSRLNASATATPTSNLSDAEEENRENVAPTETHEETKEERRERKRKRKEEKEAKRNAKESRSASAAVSPAPIVSQTESSIVDVPIQVTTVETTVRPAPFNPRMASRARHIASKKMLHASAEALAEILGIAPTPSPGPSTPSTSLAATRVPSKESTPAPAAAITPALSVSEAEGKDKESAEERARRKAEKKAAKEAAKAQKSAGAGSEEDKKAKKKKRKREASGEA